jgi:ribosomal protein S18 acetylase RimI-like enzyme
MPRAPRRAPAAEIRPARPGDLPALARLGAKLARAHHAWDPARFFLPDEPIEAGYAWWLGKELRSRSAVILAAAAPSGDVGERRGSRRRLPRSERGSGGRSFTATPGKIVGYAYGRLEPRDWNLLLDACGVAVDLWVEPEARRAGLGGRLTEALVAALEARGAPRVVLSAASRNPGARRLFRKLGFRPTMLEMTRERRAPPNETRPGGRRGRTLGA